LPSARLRQPALKPAARRQHAAAAVLTETFHQRLPLLERAHHLAERNLLRRASETEATADAALGSHKTGLRQVADHFRQMMAGNPELSGDIAGRERPVAIGGEPHQRTQAEVGELGQAHGCVSKSVFTERFNRPKWTL
jgi:hypothetical protein